jgi:hypothetical protein
VASQVADLTDRVPQAITGAHPILRADHVAWEWPRELNELPIILNKMLGSLRLDLQLPDSGFRDRSEARGWTSGDTRQGGGPAPPPLSGDSRCTPPPRTCVVAAAPPGGRRRASRRSNSVQTLRWWLDPARGEFPASIWPLGPPPVPHAGFLGHWGPRNPLNASVATICAAGVISMHAPNPARDGTGGLGGLSGAICYY